MHRFTRVALAWGLFVLSCVVIGGRPVVAGTTGGVSGTVLDAAGGKGLAGVTITLTSPSQNARATTDANGRFTFISLAPDTYTVALQLAGYDEVTQSGVTITADTRQTLSLSLHRSLRTIGKVVSRSAADLVRPGTTADVYSINAGQQDAVSSLGGGGNLDTAYSAIGSVAGAYVPPNQSGYGQAVHIRGGDSSQVGYEFDGIPVNRGFDNSPGGSLSSLGQLELQVYTGATPANAEAQGLAGFVNQVIRTGTYPGFTNLKFDTGDPSYYHSLDLETGGSNAARTFSYYVGLGGYNQDFRYIDQFDGASVASLYGPILYQCPAPAPASLPSCFTDGSPNVGASIPGSASNPSGFNPGYVLGSPTWASPQSAASVVSRASVVNLHFGIPHGNGLRDDVQLLYDNNELSTYLFSSPQEFGAANIANLGYPSYSDSWQYTGPLGSLVTDPAQFTGSVVPYYFPASSSVRPFGGPIPANVRDVQTNGQAIVKLQYQRNFDNNSYLRLYGYTYYSDFLAAGPNSSFQPFTGYDSGDYEVNSHTRGVSATYANQLSSKHLIEAQASYTAARSSRGYNFQMFGGSDAFAVLVNPASIANPANFNGVCYLAPTTGSAASPTSCSNGSATFATLSAIGCTNYNLSCAQSGIVSPAGLTCGAGPCAYYVVENGGNGSFNHVTPAFSGLSLTDTWKPSDRLTVTAGLRLDSYRYSGGDTDSGPARAFWFASFNADNCYNPANQQLVDKSSLGVAPGTLGACPAGYQPANMVNASAQQFVYNVLQPRLGATYSLGPDTVLRGSFGKYNEQPSAAYQQYDSYAQNLPAVLTSFYAYGFNTPGHAVRPEISYNSDFSLEHHFKGTDTSFKLSPFYRTTKDQIQNFYLNIQASFISGLNVGNQTSRGFELELNKGSFARDGFAATLAFAYTNSYVKYGPLPNGTTILSTVNNSISTYNAYTKGCAPGGASQGRSQYGVPVCGSTSTGVVAAPCYSPAGVPDPACAPASIANPYWNAPAQTLFDPNGQYAPYSSFPGAIGVGYNSFSYPFTTTFVLNYRHKRFAITPNLQFQAGNRYGSPITTPGVDPAAGCAALAGRVSGDPRYPYGAAGGAPYDATTCGVATALPSQLAAIPDQYTGGFDGLGAFREPAQLVGNLRLSYDVSKRVQLVATLANVVNHCFGGQKTAFTYYSSPQVCSYTNLTNSTSPVGNVYNPSDNVQTFQKYPYEPNFGSYNDVTGVSLLQPFTAYLSVRLKL